MHLHRVVGICKFHLSLSFSPSFFKFWSLYLIVCKRCIASKLISSLKTAVVDELNACLPLRYTHIHRQRKWVKFSLARIQISVSLSLFLSLPFNFYTILYSYYCINISFFWVIFMKCSQILLYSFLYLPVVLTAQMLWISNDCENSQHLK